MKMGNYDSDDEASQLEKLRFANVKPGMFPSGWDNPNDMLDDVKDPDDSLESKIFWAVDKGKIDVIQEVLTIDPQMVHVKDEDGYTPLHRACYKNLEDVAQLLLKYKANPNAKTEVNWTPLHSACKWGCDECAALLLQNGADINARSDGLQTPLHVAATVSNCRNMATLLLMNPNIDPDALNNSNETAADIARRTGSTYPIFEMGHKAYRVETELID